MIEHSRVQEALEQLGATADATESHGVLCALLISNASMARWLELTLEGLPEQNDVLAKEHLTSLKQLFDETQHLLENEDLGFSLLLPDETDRFGLRLEGAALWCQGFVFGVGVSGLTEDENFDQQAQECLSDLLEISKLGFNVAASDEAEQQLIEIVEHLRMSTLLLNDTLNPLKRPENLD